MFPIRRSSYVLLQRIYSYSFNRFQSSTSNSSNNLVSSTSSKLWATSDTNALVKQLAARIKSTGPITVADFMRESLLNPQYVRYLFV